MNAGRKLRRSIGGGALLGALLIGGGACDDQPKPNCITSPGAYAVKLIERSRDESAPGACDDFGPDGFNADPEVGMPPFFKKDNKGQPDYAKGSVAIQTYELGALVDTAQTYGADNTGGKIYSQGDFTSPLPDGDNFCYVPKLSTTHVVLPELPAVPDDPATEDEDESFPGQAAQDITLEWSKIKISVSAAITGTQFQAELVDTRKTPSGDTCTIRYRAIGLAPAVTCGVSDPDSGMPLTNDAGIPETDVSQCDPNPNTAEGFLGSGISPSVKYECDPDIAFCMVKGDSI